MGCENELSEAGHVAKNILPKKTWSSPVIPDQEQIERLIFTIPLRYPAIFISQIHAASGQVAEGMHRSCSSQPHRLPVKGTYLLSLSDQ